MSTARSEQILRVSRTWRGWLMAMRPKTLSAAGAPVAIATALAYATYGCIAPVITLCALFFSMAIQVATNFINDALDYQRGADNAERLGPARVTQRGIFSSQQVLAAGAIAMILALLFSLPLIIVGGFPLAAVVAASIACSYLYTGGPYPLAYIGAGEFFVMLFFGWVSTVTTFFLITGEVMLDPFVAGTQVGALATVLIAINNLRDHVGDAAVCKKTLAVRWGVAFARVEITCFLALPYLLSFYWGEGAVKWLPWFTLPLTLQIASTIWRFEPGRSYNQALTLAGGLQLLFSLLMTVGWALVER